MALLNLSHDLAAAQIRHDHVEQHQVDFVGVDLESLQRRFAVFGRDDLVPGLAQHARGQLAHLFLVLNQQDSFAAALGKRFSLGRLGARPV